MLSPRMLMPDAQTFAVPETRRITVVPATCRKGD